MSTTTPLGFIVPVDADTPNGPAQIGGNAEKADELLQKGGVAGHIWVPSAGYTRTSTAYGSFGTPVKVTLPKVKPEQLLEILIAGIVSNSVGSTNATGGFVGLAINGGTTVGTDFVETPIEPGGGSTSANVPVGLVSVSLNGLTANGLFAGGEGLLNQDRRGKFLVGMENRAPLPIRWIVSAEATNLTVELVGKSTNGTLTVKNLYLSARVVG